MRSRYSTPRPSKDSIVIMGARSPAGHSSSRSSSTSATRPDRHQDMHYTPSWCCTPAYPINYSSVIRMQDRSHHLISRVTAFEGPDDGTGGRSTMHGLPDGGVRIIAWEGTRDEHKCQVLRIRVGTMTEEADDIGCPTHHIFLGVLIPVYPWSAQSARRTNYAAAMSETPPPAGPE
ncbi:hypothetical protein FS837_009164 [Tulasnella sp. UAMH 9824]|nr:hypothetical protein FS837_009164 [Tulasnella sp. UAMH 9824]